MLREAGESFGRRSGGLLPHAPASLLMPRCCRLPFKILPDVPYILARSVLNCTILHQTTSTFQDQLLCPGSEIVSRQPVGTQSASGSTQGSYQ